MMAARCSRETRTATMSRSTNSPRWMPASKPAATRSNRLLVVGRHLEHDVWVFGARTCQLRCEDIWPPARHHQSHPSCGRGPQARHLVQRPRTSARAGLSRAMNCSPASVETAAGRPGEQADAEPLLEPADRVAERRRRDPQPFRRPRETSFLCHGQECRQHAELRREPFLNGTHKALWISLSSSRSWRTATLVWGEVRDNHEDAHVGKQRPGGIGARARLHGHELRLRPGRRQAGDDRAAFAQPSSAASRSSTPPKSTARSPTKSSSAKRSRRSATRW